MCITSQLWDAQDRGGQVEKLSKDIEDLNGEKERLQQLMDATEAHLVRLEQFVEHIFPNDYMDKH
jgi:hypothetical protein